MVAAQFLAEVGDGVSLVALPLYVWARTGSEVWTSITFGVELALGVGFSVVGGILADAFDRQRVLLVSYLVRATLLLGAFVVDPLLAAVALGVSARALGMADNPSFDALIPGQARGDLQQVVALRRLIQAVSITIGPGIGALAVWLIGPRPSLLLNAGAFVVSFIVLIGVRGLDGDLGAASSVPNRPSPGPGTPRVGAGHGGYRTHSRGETTGGLHHTGHGNGGDADGFGRCLLRA